MSNLFKDLVMNKTLSIALIIALVGFPQISETIYTPALPDVATSLSTSSSAVEQTLSIYFMGFAVGVFLWGAISDFIGRRLSILLGILVYGGATFLCGSSQSIDSLLCWRFVQAFGASVGSVITMTIVRDIYQGSERIKVSSVISAALAFSPAIGPLAGGTISQFFGWRANFWALCLLAVVLIIWSYFKLRETKPENAAPISLNNMLTLATTMSASRALWGHILLVGGTNGIIFGFYQEAPFIFIDQLGMAPGTYGLFGLLIAAATIISARLGYAKSKSLLPEQIINTGVLSVLMGSGLYLLVTLSGILQDNGVGIGIACVSLFIIFFGIGLIIPSSFSTSLKAYQHMAGTAGSLFGFTYYCVIAFCTWVLSMLHNGTGLPLPMYILGLGAALYAGYSLIKWPKLKDVVSI